MQIILVIKMISSGIKLAFLGFQLKYFFMSYLVFSVFLQIDK